MRDPIKAARPTMARVLSLLRTQGLSYTELDDLFLGLGAAVRGPDTDYCVISVAAGGNESTVNLTIGVLKDIKRNRLVALDACNRLTRDNAAYPCFLHDADAGWDVLMQVRLPLSVVIDTNGYFLELVLHLPSLASTSRKGLADELGGVAYVWSEADMDRLLIRSLL